MPLVEPIMGRLNYLSRVRRRISSRTIARFRFAIAFLRIVRERADETLT